MKHLRIRSIVLGIIVVAGSVGGSALAQQAPEGPRPEVTPSGTYLVREGDTLWELSRRFLDNPRAWRQIWTRNPQITDPNLIYQGDPILVPGYVPPAPPLPVTEEPVAPVPLPAPEPPVAEAPPVPEPEPVIAKAPEEQPVFRRPPQRERLVMEPKTVECSSLVARKDEVPEGGVILQAVEEKIGMAFPDEVFISLPGTATVGDRFQILRLAGTVKHPVTGDRVGLKVLTLGTVEVTQVDSSSLRGKIVYSCQDIAVGDRLVPWQMESPLRVTETIAAEERVLGTIVGSLQDKTALGQGDVVYIDVGQDQQIVPGDEFRVERLVGKIRDPLHSQTVRPSPLDYGDLVVIRTSRTSATALLTRSNADIRVGDRITLVRKVP
ncbi:MAG: LysM peptidoglycan-binding domain-containing protein [Candidatus Methylomirabilales bacterium]